MKQKPRLESLRVVVVRATLGLAFLSVVGNTWAEEQCAVDAETVNSWLDASALPADPGSEASACAFYKLGWQQFLYLLKNGDGSSPRFLEWGNVDELFPAGSQATSPPAYPGSGVMTTRQIGKHGTVVDEIIQAAALVPVFDDNGRWLHYSVYTNQTEWDFIRSKHLYNAGCYDEWGGSYFDAIVAKDSASAAKLAALPNGSVELKLAWRVLETCDLPDSPASCSVEDTSSYLTVEAQVDPYGPGSLYREVDATLALVGFHIVAKTEEHPDWIWVTFEHEGFASDCPEEPGERQNMFCTPCPVELADWTRQVQDRRKAWSADDNPYLPALARRQAAGDPQQAVLTDDGESIRCASLPDNYEFADPPLYNPRACDGSGDPTSLCRENPIPAEVQTLNSAVMRALGAAGSLSQNYRMVGTMWFDKDCRQYPDDCQQQGAKGLTNTTMETFEQWLGPIGGCTVCHGKNQFNPVPYHAKPSARGLADRSFIFQRIQQFLNCDL